MAYDYTEGGSAGAGLPVHRPAIKVLKRVMNTAAIIASNATLTAAAKITAADIIEAIPIPDNFICLFTVIRVVTKPAGALTVDVGLAGGDEFQDGADIFVTAGTIAGTLVGDDYGYATVQFKDFEAADTIDVTYVNDATDGEFNLYAVGFMLD